MNVHVSKGMLVNKIKLCLIPNHILPNSRLFISHTQYLVLKVNTSSSYLLMLTWPFTSSTGKSTQVSVTVHNDIKKENARVKETIDRAL